MPTAYLVLGQAYPPADTLTDLYVVPANSQAVVSSLTVCNQSVSQIFWRLAVRPGGAAVTNKHWIVYDSPVDPGETDIFTIGLTLAAGDVVSVNCAGLQGVSFSLFGSVLT